VIAENTALKAARDALQQRTEELAASLNALTQAAASAESNSAEREENAAAIRAALQSQLDEVQRSLLEAQQALNTEAAEKATLQEELKAARQTAALSTKLMNLRDADFRDLQDRYSKLLAQQRQQKDLLEKLAARLSTANEYFEQLRESQQQIPKKQYEIGHAPPRKGRPSMLTRIRNAIAGQAEGQENLTVKL
jgi:chromosome segregation ATPase